MGNAGYERCFTAALLLLYCCFVQVLMVYAGYERCFTASLLLLYCCFTAAVCRC
jgi:hypothetical protein